MRLTPQIKQAAITLTELLVVLVVIGILSTIALPVYINQAERARFAAAHQEVYEIAQAMDACGMEHGRYVPLQVLDDLPGDAGDQGSTSDNIRDDTGLFAIDFNIATRFLDVDGNSDLNISSPDPRTAEMVRKWKGPFINFQRFYIPSGFTNREQNHFDFPLDPWGNPYRFYSPVGIIGSSNISSTGNYSRGDFNGALSTSDDRFDRYEIVSWGSDGISETDATNNNDDVVYQFGYARTETPF